MEREPSPASACIGVEIAERLADELGVRVADLPPLTDRVDTDALEAIISSAETEGLVSVEFEFQDRHVFVDSTREIDIT